MNKNLSLAVPEEVKKLQTKHEKLKKEKEERDNKEKEDLEKINELNSQFKKLKHYIVSNMEIINNGYSDVNDKVKEALEQFKNVEEEIEVDIQAQVWLVDRHFPRHHPSRVWLQL